MIIAIVGRRGQGKSALATYRAFQAHQKGIEVHANYELKFPFKRYIDMKNIQNACVVLDEGYIYADARRSMSNANVFISQAIAQCRKNRNTLYFVTQSTGWLDQRIRWSFDIIDMCKAYNTHGKRKIFDHEKIAFVNVIRTINFEKPLISVYRFYPNRAGVFNLYDTYEVIEKDHRKFNRKEIIEIENKLFNEGFSFKEIKERLLEYGIKRSVSQILRDMKTVALGVA